MEVPVKNFAEYGLHRVGMVVNREYPVYASKLKHLCIKPCCERLTIKFLSIMIVAFKMSYAVINTRSPILSAVVKIWLNQHDLLCTILFGAASNEQIPHGQVLAAHHPAGGADDNHGLALELGTDGREIAFIRNKARTKLGVGEVLHADQISNIFGLTDCKGHIDRKGVI